MPCKMLRQSVVAKQKQHEFKSRKVAVELLMPSGPLQAYGLLGGEFFPRPSGTLDLELGILDSSQRKYTGATVSRFDVVTVGFPEEFSAAVIQGLLEAEKYTSLPAGNFFIKCAASGAVGSNRIAFRTAMRILVQIIEIPHHLISDTLITDTVQAILERLL